MELQAAKHDDHDDPLPHSLTNIILAGWPQDINGLPCPLCLYHSYCDVLTAEDGLILRGKTLIIHPAEREKMLAPILEGHLGITKYQYQAQQCVYWPGINSDIKCTVEICVTCQCYHPQEPQQYLGADYTPR